VKATDKLAFAMTWQVVTGAAAAIFVMVVFSSLFSIWRVIRLEPAVVFKG
jgi:hypothetical protein